MRASKWKMLDNELENHCSERLNEKGERIALIEKSPRVLTPEGEWEYGSKGCGQECGRYQPSRDWCDEKLESFGYKLEN